MADTGKTWVDSIIFLAPKSQGCVIEEQNHFKTRVGLPCVVVRAGHGTRSSGSHLDESIRFFESSPEDSFSLLLEREAGRERNIGERQKH